MRQFSSKNMQKKNWIRIQQSQFLQEQYGGNGPRSKASHITNWEDHWCLSSPNSWTSTTTRGHRRWPHPPISQPLGPTAVRGGDCDASVQEPAGSRTANSTLPVLLALLHRDVGQYIWIHHIHYWCCKKWAIRVGHKVVSLFGFTLISKITVYTAGLIYTIL